MENTTIQKRAVELDHIKPISGIRSILVRDLIIFLVRKMFSGASGAWNLTPGPGVGTKLLSDGSYDMMLRW